MRELRRPEQPNPSNLIRIMPAKGRDVAFSPNDRRSPALSRASQLMRKAGGAALAAACLLILWRAAVAAFAIPPYILPGPERVAAAFVRSAPQLLEHGATTATEMLLGLFCGALLGCVVATVMAALTPARRLLLPVLVIAQALPVFAIAPLLVVWLGYGLASKITMTVLIVMFPVASSFLDGLRRTDPALLDLARVHGANRFRTLTLIQLPAALPALGSGLRVAAAVAPVGAVVGEWVGAAGGLGFLMLQANARAQTDLMFAALSVIALFALVLRFAVEAATRRLAPWAAETS